VSGSAAEIDGAGVIRTLVRVAARPIGPGLAAGAAPAFSFTWNDRRIAPTAPSGEAAANDPVGPTEFVTRFGVDRGPTSSAGVLMVVPTLVTGLVAGAVRG